MEAPVLSINKVNKHFGGVVAVQDMSFDVHEGEVLGLMGPNGAGKTTLLNLIAGEYKPDSGTIKLKGKTITGSPPHKACHLGIARTYQIPQPFGKLTTLQNIMVAVIYGRGFKGVDIESEALKILEITGLTDKKDTFASNLLVLTLKRLELARALAANPALLLIDEVAAGLTEDEIPRLLSILKHIREMGISLIVIEHVIKVLVQAADRIIVMDKGAKLAEGTPQEVIEDRKVIEAYFG